MRQFRLDVGKLIEGVVNPGALVTNCSPSASSRAAGSWTSHRPAGRARMTHIRLALQSHAPGWPLLGGALSYTIEAVIWLRRRLATRRARREAIRAKWKASSPQVLSTNAVPHRHPGEWLTVKRARKSPRISAVAFQDFNRAVDAGWRDFFERRGVPPPTRRVATFHNPINKSPCRLGRAKMKTMNDEMTRRTCQHSAASRPRYRPPVAGDRRCRTLQPVEAIRNWQHVR